MVLEAGSPRRFGILSTSRLLHVGVALYLAIALSACSSNVYLLGVTENDGQDVATILKPKEDSLGFYYHITTVTAVDGRSTGYQLRDIEVVVPTGQRTLSVLYNAKDKPLSARQARASVVFEA